MSMQVRIDLGIPKKILNIYPDLPINEQLTKNLDAFRYYVLGNLNILGIKYRKKLIPGSNYINWNKAIELDSTFAIALWRNAYNNDLYQSFRVGSNIKLSKQIRFNGYGGIRFRNSSFDNNIFACFRIFYYAPGTII